MNKGLSSPNWIAIDELLNSWFASGFTRHSSLPFDSSQSSWETALLAASLFKRGAQSLHCLKSGEVRTLSQREPDSKSPRISVHSRLSNFLDASPLSLPHTAVVCDETFSLLHPKFMEYIQAKNIPLLRLKCSEENKSFTGAQSIYHWIPKNTRNIVVIGGGICCDLGAFVGGLLCLKIHLVPTTLLAAIDAGLGGKTGVNHPVAGKNQIGMFVKLESVDVVTEFFNTLDTAQIREGLAEILKHSFLSGTFEQWHSSLREILNCKMGETPLWVNYHSLLSQNLAFKNSVVLRDPFEQNIRAFLNFGHTTAHLIEGLAATAPGQIRTKHISHGCAVALGILCFLKLGWARNAPEGFQSLLEEILSAEQISLPLAALNGIQDFASALLLQDKKNTSPIHSNFVRCVTPSYGCLGHLDFLTEAKLESLLSKNTTQIDAGLLLKKLCNIGLFS